MNDRPALNWPSDDEPVPVRRGWRDTFTAATELALLGIVTAVVSVAVVTAGGAVATASAAAHQWCETQDMPSAAQSWRRFQRAFLPGIVPGLIGLAVALTLLLNAIAVANGRVPGGGGFLVITALVAVLVLGFLAYVVVRVGRSDGLGWLTAVRSAWESSASRPWVPLTLGGVVVFAGFLGLALPVCAPLLVGYTLFGTHVVVRRLER